MKSKLPSAHGNGLPPHRLTITIPGGPLRLTDDGERSRFHVGKGRAPPRPAVPRLALCRKILVVKLDFIGDWVLTTPFLASLRVAAPRAEITVLVLHRAFALAETSRLADRVVAVEAADRDRVTFAAATIGDLAQFRGDYLDSRFDVALVPRWDIDFNGALKLAWASGAPTVGFSEHNTAAKSLLNRGDDRFYSRALLDRRILHEVEHNLPLIEALGGQTDTHEASIDLEDRDFAAADAFLADAFGARRRPLLSAAPFADAAKKRLPADRLASVVARLSRHFGLDVAVVASSHQHDEAERFAALVGPDAVSASSLKLRQSAALLARSAVFIGLDSGPAHMAAAVGTPVAVLFAAPVGTRPDHIGSPARFAPWGDPSRLLVVQPEDHLEPCEDGCDASEAHCILQLTEAVLWPQLRDFVARFVVAKPVRQRAREQIPG